MNKKFFPAIPLFLALFFFGEANAAVTQSVTDAIQVAKEREATLKTFGINEPCLKLRTVCQAAGFVPYGTAGNDIWMNCITPIFQGKTIPNLKLNPADLESCKQDFENIPCTQVMETCRKSGFDSSGPGKLAMFDCLFPIVQGKVVTGVNPPPGDLAACKTLMKKIVDQNPCLKVMLACRQAGFSPDSVNGQAFALNCLVPVSEGKKVQGVNIDSATASACYAKMHSGSPPPNTNNTPSKDSIQY